jgi:hypothetical protein
MSKTQELKKLLQSEYPNHTFSVRKTRNNGWVGQVIEVEYRGHAEAINFVIDSWEIANKGYTVEVLDMDAFDEMTRKFAERREVA